METDNMLLITNRKRRTKPSGPTPEEIAATPAARLEKLSNELWTGHVTKQEHDARVADLIRELRPRRR